MLKDNQPLQSTRSEPSYQTLGNPDILSLDVERLISLSYLEIGLVAGGVSSINNCIEESLYRGGA